MTEEAMAAATKIKALLLDVLHREQLLGAFLNATDDIKPLIDAEFAPVIKERDELRVVLRRLWNDASEVLGQLNDGDGHVDYDAQSQLTNSIVSIEELLEHK